MRLTSFLSTLTNWYLHGLADFPGKWRALKALSYFVDGIPVKSRFGPWLTLEVNDRTNQLCVLGKYAKTVPTQVARLRPGECFVDVGANCGIFSLIAAGNVGPEGLVIAFEPCLQTFGKLVDNIELNGFHNILPFNLAVSEATGRMTLDCNAPGHSGRYRVSSTSDCVGQPIASLALDGFPGMLSLIEGRSTVIKIDVEGFEFAVLQGLDLLLSCPSVRAVIVEIDDENLSRYGSNALSIYEKLGSLGFVAQEPDELGSHRDVVFERRCLAEAAGADPSPVFFSAPRQQRQVAVRTAEMFARLAAALLLLCGGWFAAEELGPNPSYAKSSFVSEALESQTAARVRASLRRSPPAVFDLAEVGRTIGVDLPTLPKPWRVTDVQVFPSDAGPSVSMAIHGAQERPLFLFIGRSDEVGSPQPELVEHGQFSIAVWQEGSSALALIGTTRSVHSVANILAVDPD